MRPKKTNAIAEIFNGKSWDSYLRSEKDQDFAFMRRGKRIPLILLCD